MLFDKVKNSYELQENSFLAQIEDNHEIVRLILIELQKNLIFIVKSREVEPEQQARYYAKAQTALHLLISSLDSERGGEISANLARLYLYIQQQLIDGRRRKGFDGDPNIVGIVNDLLEAWEKI